MRCPTIVTNMLIIGRDSGNRLAFVEQRRMHKDEFTKANDEEPVRNVMLQFERIWK